MWQNGDTDSIRSVSVDDICSRFRRLIELVNDEIRAPAPHLCISFAASSRLLVIVLRVASSLPQEDVVFEALRLCSVLIDSEEEDFLADPTFARTLTEFIGGIANSGPLNVDLKMENTMVEVLFGVASKIRLQPEILPVWFRNSALKSDVDESDYTVATKEDFPLFHILLNYIHYEGRAGEFARMGLLYLIEATSRSEDLERWVVESDLATLMASGLGALYSQLSR